MKKWIALLLAAVLCLSLAACGDSKTEENSGTVQGQTTDNSTQDTDEPSSADVPQDTDEPSSAELTEQTVEITLDNWQDYMEINQYLGVYYAMNSFGEATNTYLDFYTLLELKEEYSNYKADIAVEYDMDYCVSDIIYNLDDFSFELIDCVSHPDATVDESLFIRGKTGKMNEHIVMNRNKIVDGKVEQDWIAYESWERPAMSFSFELPGVLATPIEQNEDGTGYIDKCPTNIQITRIEGTLEYNN